MAKTTPLEDRITAADNRWLRSIRVAPVERSFEAVVADYTAFSGPIGPWKPLCPDNKPLSEWMDEMHKELGDCLDFF